MTQERQNPIYDYAKGLDSTMLSFAIDGSAKSTKEHIPAEKLILDDKDPETARIQNAVASDLSKLRTISTGKGDLEYAMVNSHQNNGRITIVNPAWGVSYRAPSTVREITSLVINDPTRTFLALHAPGVDDSTQITTAMAKKMAETGRYAELGDYLMRTLMRGPLQYFDDIDIVGHSQGGRNAIGMAEASNDVLGRQINELRISDPVGSLNQTLLQFARAFILREGPHSKKYTAASIDPVSKALQQAGDSPIAFLKKLKQMIGNGGLLGFIRQIRAMSRAGLKDDLHASIENVRDRILITSPELSELNDVNTVTSMIRELMREVDQPPIVQQRIVHGHTHSYHAGNPRIFGTVLSKPEHL